MEQLDAFRMLQQFVPMGYQLTAKNFLYYLKTLTPKRYNAMHQSIDVKDNGLEILDYRPATTSVQFYKWSDLERIIGKEFGDLSPQFTEQLTLFTNGINPFS